MSANPPLEPPLLLAYGTATHRKLRDYVVTRRKASEEAMSERWETWEGIDDHWRMYLATGRPATRSDKTSDSRAEELPNDYAVVIPATFAALLVRLSQEYTVFAARNPLVELAGVAPEDVGPDRAMEALLAYDLRQSNVNSVMWSLLQNAERYGMAPLADSWEEDWGPIIDKPQLDIRRVPPPLRGLALRIAGQQFQPSRRYGLRKQWVRWRTVDPYLYWPDPYVPVGNPQAGDWCGDRTYLSRMWFAQREAEARTRGGESQYFNLDHLKRLAESIYSQNDERSRRWRQQQTRNLGSVEGDPRPMAVDTFQLRLIPRELGLGPSPDPELWHVEIVEDEVIVRAHPAEPWHEQYGYSVGEVLPDPHAFCNPGWAEQIDGLQRMIDWLINSHLEYTMRRVNGGLVWVPELLEEGDIINPRPGGDIRVTELAARRILAGRLDINSCYRQLEMPDATTDHLSLAGYLFDWGQRMVGASDPQMAMPLPSKRTLGEVRTITAMGTQRVVMTCSFVDSSCIQPSVARAISLEQQFRDEEMYVRIEGELAEEYGAGQVLVNPRDIYGQYDYVPISGSSLDPAAGAQSWLQLMQIIGKAPQLAQQFDWASGFKEFARLVGVRNVAKFFRQPTPPPGASMPGVRVVPDDQLAAARQAGNAIPMEGATAQDVQQMMGGPAGGGA